MRKSISWTIALSLILATSIGAGATRPPGVGPNASVESLLALLPDSDVVAVIDMPRAARELLPLLKMIDLAGISKLAADFEEFAALAALDPAKISSAVLAVKMEGLKVRGGVLIVEGIELDSKAMEAAASTKRWKFQTVDQQVRPIYRIERPAPAADPAATAKSDELFFAALGSKRAVAGDIASVKNVLRNLPDTSAIAPPAPNVTLQAALKQANPSSLARFALALPADLRQLLDGQGDLFKQLAAVKVIFGTLDMTSDKSAAIKAMLSTNSRDEATQMEASLKSLVALGKSFLGGDQIAQLLDQVQIGVQESDVSLSLVIPKALLDQLTKSPSPPK